MHILSEIWLIKIGTKQAQRPAAAETATRKYSIYIIVIHDLKLVRYIIIEEFK